MNLKLVFFCAVLFVAVNARVARVAKPAPPKPIADIRLSKMNRMKKNLNKYKGEIAAGMAGAGLLVDLLLDAIDLAIKKQDNSILDDFFPVTVIYSRKQYYFIF
jgi:hypothetical protein